MKAVDSKDDDVAAHAKHALKKLERARAVGAKKGNTAPTQEEVDFAKVCIACTIAEVAFSLTL
jgi:hypothetical protein